MHRLLLGSSLALALTFGVSAADWDQFRGPTGQGHADAKGLPTEWGPDQNVAWRTELPGKGWSSPVVAGGKVYLTTGVVTGGELSLRGLCVDAKTGKVDWDREVFKHDVNSAGPVHNKNSYASPTAVIEKGRVYVHFGHLGTACLDAKDGTPVWTNPTLKYSPVHGNGGSPVLAGGRLVVNIDGTDRQEVVALDKGTGKVAWRTPRNARAARPFSFSTPLLITAAGKEQLISAGSDVVMSLDPKTGKEIWRVRYAGYSVVPRPVYGNGLVYLSTGFDNPAVYAVRPDGTGDVTATHVAWTVKRAGMPRNASPLLVGDALYVVSDGGLVSCLDAKTGADRWKEPEGLGGTYWASPLYAGGLVYLLSENGTGTVFKPGPQYDPVATNKLGERTFASPAVDGSALLIRTEKALYRIEKK